MKIHHKNKPNILIRDGDGIYSALEIGIGGSKLGIPFAAALSNSTPALTLWSPHTPPLSQLFHGCLPTHRNTHPKTSKKKNTPEKNYNLE